MQRDQTFNDTQRMTELDRFRVTRSEADQMWASVVSEGFSRLKLRV